MNTLIIQRTLVLGGTLFAMLNVVNCGGTKTSLSIDVGVRKGVHDVSALQVQMQIGRAPSYLETIQETLVPTDTGILFSAESPTETINIVAAGRRGPALITVRALNPTGQVVASGSFTVDLINQEHREATLVLNPTDFAVDSALLGNLSFASGNSGRNAASQAGKGFVFTWLRCESPAGCTVFVQSYSDDGRPLGATAEGPRPQIVVTQRPEPVDSPTVAMQGNGSFVVAWQENGIFTRAFSSLDAIASDTTRSRISTEGMQTSTPHIIPLRQGRESGYLVAWAEANEPTTARIMGRFISETGQVLAEHNPFTIATVALENSDQISEIKPFITGGSQGRFAATWIDSADVRARTFDGPGEPASEIVQVPVRDSGRASAPAIIGINGGYALVWEDIRQDLFTNTDTSGSSIRVRRLRQDGRMIDDNDHTLNTTIAGDQRRPVIANSGENGQLLVAWQNKEPADDSNSGSPAPTVRVPLRARLLLENGMPIGDDFILTTTLAPNQQALSLGGFGAEAFVAAFMAQDAEISTRVEIRGRLIYADFAPTHRGIGAVCDNGDGCLPSLLCVPHGETLGRRCVDQCKSQGAYCPNGGRCLDAIGTRLACIY